MHSWVTPVRPLVERHPVWVALGWIAISAGVAATALGLGSPWHLLAPTLAAAGVTAAVLWRQPLFAASCLPLLLPPPQVAKVFAYEVALIAVAAMMLLVAWRSRARWLLRFDPIELTAAALLGWAMVTVMWSTDLWWWTFGIRKLGIGCLALWVSWRLAGAFGSRHLMSGIAMGAIALAVVTLAKALTSGWLTAGDAFGRRDGTDLGWGTSNFIGALLALMLPTSFHLALHSTRRGVRLLGWLTLPAVALVMTVAASRGGTLLFVLIGAGVVFRERLNRRTISIAVGALLSTVLLVLSPGGARLIERFSDPRELGSIVVRWMYFLEGWRRLLATLPFGMGQGQGYVYPDRLGTQDPHNYWLVLGPELGLPGLVLWIALLVLVWRRLAQHARRPETRQAARTMQLTFLVAQINSMYEPTFQGLQYHFLFYWILGAYLGSMESATSAGTPPVRPRSSARRTNPVAT